MLTEKTAIFTLLLKENKKVIFKILNQYLSTQDYHDDLFQDIALKAWVAFDNFQHKSKFSTWIGKITQYTIIDKLRSMRVTANRIAKYNIFYEITYCEIWEEYTEPSLPVIDSLSEAEKRTLQCRIDGLTFVQISELTGEPINRLMIRMHRIKDKLRKAVK